LVRAAKLATQIKLKGQARMKELLMAFISAGCEMTPIFGLPSSYLNAGKVKEISLGHQKDVQSYCIGKKGG
jgi:hypothetical protein